MKAIKKIIVALLMPLVLVSYFSCSSAKMLQNESQLEIGKVYYQESNSMTTVFIPIKSNPNNIVLDSVYFKGKQAKLEHKNNLFIGNFASSIAQKQDVIMSNEPYAEYGNQVLKLPKKSPFELKDNECMVSYKKENETKYFKIENIIQK